MLNRETNNNRLRQIVQANRVDGVIPIASVTRMTHQLIGLFDELIQAALSEAPGVSSLPLAVRAPELARYFLPDGTLSPAAVHEYIRQHGEPTVISDARPTDAPQWGKCLQPQEHGFGAAVDPDTECKRPEHWPAPDQMTTTTASGEPTVIDYDCTDPANPAWADCAIGQD